MTVLDGLQLRRATAEDAPRLQELIAAAGRAMAAQGFRNWLSPDAAERSREDIATREVYIVSDGRSDVATFNLGVTARRPYSPEPWLDPGAPALYLSRLAVDPALQGGGIGGWCLEQVERLARERGARAVRCDVLTANARLCRLYERWGYEPRGERSHGGWDFTCYERVID
jgi:ribosomal protein S18 acetylase RimI-like enzyme